MDSNPKSKIKKVFYIVITLIVISALALIYMNSQKQKIVEPVQPTMDQLTEQQKSDILNQLGQPPNVNLSDQDKQKILDNLSSGQ